MRPSGPVPVREFLLPGAVLVLVGVCWGLTQPLAKIAVSTGHRHLGLIFWQLVICAMLLAVLVRWRGTPLPFTRGTLQAYIIIALVGTVVPGSASYQAIVHLPSGIISILLSLVPMMAFPMALALGREKFQLVRLLGLLAGLAGVLLLVLPDANFATSTATIWILVALVAPFCYAFEGNYVAHWGIGGLDPIQVLCGASIVGALLALPLAVGSDQFINPVRVWEAAEWALVATSVIHALTYAGYIWLVGRAGPVFSVQVSYIVTVSGVVWAIIVLGESYASSTWAAMALVLFGVLLVRPKETHRLDQRGCVRQATTNGGQS